MMKAVSPGLRVLHVEDEPANRALVRSILARTSRPELRACVLHEAATIAEARTVTASEVLDVVLVDVRLPDGSGLDLVAELQARRPVSPVRVVIVSASVLSGERAKAMSTGADAFLGKPFSASELTDLLVDLTARGRGGHERSRSSSGPSVDQSEPDAPSASAVRGDERLD